MVAEDVGGRVLISEREVPERFSELMARVERGETVAIMRNGKVVAEFSSGSEPGFDREKAEAAVKRFREQMEEWRKTEPTGITREEILKWRHEGHRR